MAQSYTSDASTFFIPGAYAKYTVNSAPTGISTTGVLVLVGEADAGPDFTLETDLSANAFGPDQLAFVIAKYKSGPLVDAFFNATQPSNDPQITATFASVILVKTNKSVRATSQLLNNASANYAVIEDRSYGALGNLVGYTVANHTAEVVPTTGAFTFIPPTAAFDMEIRRNGSSKTGGALTVAAGTAPSAFVTAVNGAAVGVSATGGTNRNVLSGSGDTLTISYSGNNAITLATSGTFAASPVAGDTLVIAAWTGAANNKGAYVVTSYNSSTKTVSATKLADASGGTPGTVTAPSAGTYVVAATSDIAVYAPVTISGPTANPIDGLGKSLEIAELTTNTDKLSNAAKTTAGANVTWISKSGAPLLITSAAENVIDLTVARQYDAVSETHTVGGDIPFTVGFTGDSGSITIGAKTITTTVATGTNLSLNIADYKTVNDLVTYIAAQTGYTAKVGNTTLGQLSPTVLDEGTYNIASKWGAQPGRVKMDAAALYNELANNSTLVQLDAQPSAGLPAVKSMAFLGTLAKGAKGATLAADVTGAIDALESIDCNIIVPLFSRDATLDITAGTTDSASTYVVDDINNYVKTHVLKMSTLKRRRNRQAIVSKQDKFYNQKQAAANLACFRMAMAFEDIKVLGANGLISTFQPWMGAVNAAALQLGAFNKAIFNKKVNVTGVLHNAGDFNPKNDSQVEDALKAGLLPIRPARSGGFAWVSDQTTYGTDNNFVFNSIQAVYVADMIALSSAQQMEDKFIGQTMGDVSAPVALSFFEAIMSNFSRLKLIAGSDDAPRGYKNVVIRVSGPVMVVSAEIKLAGALYFLPISFAISAVSQSASI